MSKDESGIQYMDKNEKTFKPTFLNRGNKEIDFHLLAFGKEVQMEIFNSKGQRLYQESYKGLETISKGALQA